MIGRLLVTVVLITVPTTAAAQFDLAQQLLASGGSAGGDEFGVSVALDAGTAVVGAWGDGAGQGAAYVFTRSGTTWTEQQTLRASGGVAGDGFGVSVAVDGDTAVIGARLYDGSVGTAYVFTRSGTTWTQQQQLLANDGAPGDEFGVSVVLDGDTAVVGARGDDVGAVANHGSAYVFTRSGTTWTQQAQLLASEGAADEVFGTAAAMAGDTVLIGAFGAEANQGAAYVFVRSGMTWTQQQQLLASDAAPGDEFGVSVALDGDTAAVGASGAVGNEGATYVFTRDGTMWTEQQQLLAGGGAPGDAFGDSVALDGDTTVIGARNDDIGAALGRGSAYVFARSGTLWTQRQHVAASDGAANEAFGWSVAVHDDTIVIGTPRDEVGVEVAHGSAHVFTNTEATNPVPTVTSLSPSVAAGGAEFTLTATGANFAGTSTVEWNGTSRLTTYASAQSLLATILASDIATAGSAAVSIRTPAPGGGLSNSLLYQITNPVPTVTSLAPSTTVAGGAAFTLTVNGTNFVNASTVEWNGVTRETTYVTDQVLEATIPTSDIATVGSAEVTVRSPLGGGVSNGLAFTRGTAVFVLEPTEAGTYTRSWTLSKPDLSESYSHGGPGSPRIYRYQIPDFCGFGCTFQSGGSGHAYFVYDLSSVTDTIGAASLNMSFSDTLEGSASVHQVETAVSSLLLPSSGDTAEAIYDDLTGGAEYAAATETEEVLALSEAVFDLNAMRGGRFAIGVGGRASTPAGAVVSSTLTLTTFIFRPGLTVTISGSGTGVVTSHPTGIDCPGTCEATFPKDTVVTLTAVADAGATVVNISGHPDCSDGTVTLGGDVTTSGDVACDVSIAETSFTDMPLVAGESNVRGLHITELRDRIDALRLVHGLSVAAWTDTLVSGAPIRAVHVTEIRTALDQVYVAAGRAKPSYTDPVLVGAPMRAVHITELRGFVMDLG